MTSAKDECGFFYKNEGKYIAARGCLLGITRALLKNNPDEGPTGKVLPDGQI
jgi:hypothetical protein